MSDDRRSSADRRSGKDRRKKIQFRRWLDRGGSGRTERRHSSERRSTEERRSGWVRIGKWTGVQLKKLKIAKFLK